MAYTLSAQRAHTHSTMQIHNLIYIYSFSAARANANGTDRLLFAAACQLRFTRIYCDIHTHTHEYTAHDPMRPINHEAGPVESIFFQCRHNHKDIVWARGQMEDDACVQNERQLTDFTFEEKMVDSIHRFQENQRNCVQCACGERARTAILPLFLLMYMSKDDFMKTCAVVRHQTDHSKIHTKNSRNPHIFDCGWKFSSALEAVRVRVLVRVCEFLLEKRKYKNAIIKCYGM